MEECSNEEKNDSTLPYAPASHEIPKHVFHTYSPHLSKSICSVSSNLMFRISCHWGTLYSHGTSQPKTHSIRVLHQDHGSLGSPKTADKIDASSHSNQIFATTCLVSFIKLSFEKFEVVAKHSKQKLTFYLYGSKLWLTEISQNRFQFSSIPISKITFFPYYGLSLTLWNFNWEFYFCGITFYLRCHFFFASEYR